MNAQANLEVADIVRACEPELLQRYGATLSSWQRRVLKALRACRTAELGGHVGVCTYCGDEQIAYNSCRNRHCPKCLAKARAVWLEREASYLLPVEYHHVVFTLPAELSKLALANPKVLYGILFRAANQTLTELAADPHYLGAQLGVLAVLHTWGQNLHHHPHLHCVATGGGLSCNVRGKRDPDAAWRCCRAGFFLPVRVLSRLFRGKFLALVQQSFERQQLRLAGSLACLAEARMFQNWLTPLYQKEWVVYAKPPFAGPEAVLKYLARYTHRVAISNRRLLAFENGQVTFRYKDYRHGHRPRHMTLGGVEFLRRLLQHVLPRGFVKIRHYGLLANRSREENLKTSRRLLLVVTAVVEEASDDDSVDVKTSWRCPTCGERRMARIRILPREPIGGKKFPDTS